MLAEEEFSRILDHRLDQVAWPVHGGGPASAEHLRLLEDIFEGCDNEGILGWEMMELRAPGHAGFLRHLSRPKTGVAALADQIPRGLQDARARFLRARGPGAPA